MTKIQELTAKIKAKRAEHRAEIARMQAELDDARIERKLAIEAKKNAPKAPKKAKAKADTMPTHERPAPIAADHVLVIQAGA